MAILEINSFHGGTNLSVNPLLLKTYEASLAKNVELSEIGTLKKARGYRLLNSFQTLNVNTWQASTSYSVGNIVKPSTPNGFFYKCTTAGTSGTIEPSWSTTKGQTVNDGSVVWTCISPTEAINNLYAFYKIVSGNVERYFLIEWNGNFYKYDFAINNFVFLYALNSIESKPASWITYQNKAIRFAEGDNPLKFDGSSFANLGGDPPKGKYAVVYKERVYVAGVSPNYSTVYFSDIGGPEAWNPNNQFDVNANDGDQITGLAVLGDSLLIFKENSIWEIQVDQQNIISFKRLFASEIGTTSARSIVNISNVLYFFDRNGVWAIYQKYPELISAKVKPFIDAVQDPYSVVGWTWKQKYHLYIGDIQYEGRLFKNVVLVYDTVYNQWTFRTFEDIVLNGISFIKSDKSKNFYFSTKDGKIFDFDKGYSYGGKAIEVEYELPILQPEDPDKRKIFREVLVRLADKAKSKPSVSVIIDGRDPIDLGSADEIYKVFSIAQKLGVEEGRDLRIRIHEISDVDMNDIYQIVIKWDYIKAQQAQK
jgi:hypothetical protein